MRNCSVLGFGQIILRNLTAREALVLLQQCGRAQKTTNVFGPKWGLLARQSVNTNIHGDAAVPGRISLDLPATGNYIGPWILLSRTTWPQRAISLLSSARAAATVRWSFG